MAESKSSQDTQPAKGPGANTAEGSAKPASNSLGAQPTAPQFLHYRLTPSGSYFIDGSQEMKKANKDVLGPLYVHPTGIMAAPAQLGKLIAEFERRKVPFRDVTPREAGE